MSESLPIFEDTISQNGVDLSRTEVKILQINNGKLCNMACLHCHVEAGPKRTELMDRRTSERIIELLSLTPSVHTLDITGGAPEMNPHFRWMVEEARQLNRAVIDRCNLTILLEDGYTDLRGRFDYTSRNTNELDMDDKFSVLIMSDENGAVVREANPPKR